MRLLRSLRSLHFPRLLRLLWAAPWSLPGLLLGGDPYLDNTFERQARAMSDSPQTMRPPVA